MTTALSRIALGAVLAIAVAGAASAAETTLKVKASTSAAMAGKCAAATTLFAKLSESDAKPGEDRSMSELAITWLTFLKDAPEAFQTSALTSMSSTADGYSKAMEKSTNEALAAIAGDVATCILEME
ncbi:hypothetical protein [Caulobacter sp. NIBR1757]|uniref:hypothetical protein n=1 Tax=Caulobacter sp. NIBR1757 TaxID=3016000 RepID=UPI0022F0A42F|nr:hypothetical protein [Caulobacter sp. NIBR1757]WGM39714.1 hypothetical protein AMEJIAPC_02640 [Caulobacter sp. NIBR1757]